MGVQIYFFLLLLLVILLMSKGVEAIARHIQVLDDWLMMFDQDAFSHDSPGQPYTILEDMYILINMHDRPGYTRKKISKDIIYQALYWRTWKGIEDRFDSFLAGITEQDMQTFVAYIKNRGPSKAYLGREEDGKIKITNEVPRKGKPRLGKKKICPQENKRQYVECGVQYSEDKHVGSFDRSKGLVAMYEELSRKEGFFVSDERPLMLDLQGKISDRLFQDEEKKMKPITLLLNGEHQRFKVEQFMMMAHNSSGNIGNFLRHLVEVRRNAQTQHEWSAVDDEQLVRSYKSKQLEKEYEDLQKRKQKSRVLQRVSFLKSEKRWKPWTQDEADTLKETFQQAGMEIGYKQLVKKKKLWRTLIRVDWLKDNYKWWTKRQDMFLTQCMDKYDSWEFKLISDKMGVQNTKKRTQFLRQRKNQ